MPFEDMGIYCAYPNITIWMCGTLSFAGGYPTDGIFLGRTVHPFQRKEGEAYYGGNEKIQIGKGNIVREGNDITVIACGIEVTWALQAAEKLAEENIQARVVDMFTIKPLDAELALRCARETGAVVTAETTIFTAVSEVRWQKCWQRTALCLLNG